MGKSMPQTRKKKKTSIDLAIGGNVSESTIIVGNGNTILKPLEPTECYQCGKLCLPNEAYRCKKCQRVYCTTHRIQTDFPLCKFCIEITEWEAMLSSPNGNERIEAAKQLCAFKENSTLPTLEKRLLREQNEYVRYWIAYALGKIGGDKAYKILKEAQSRERHPYALQGIQDAMDELKHP
jgi:hypothetical protein